MDYRDAALDPARRALCDFAVALTLRPAAVSAGDVERLRGLGYEDATISDAIQVIGYFNYINRVADGVGVDPEPEWAHDPGT